MYLQSYLQSVSRKSEVDDQNEELLTISPIKAQPELTSHTALHTTVILN